MVWIWDSSPRFSEPALELMLFMVALDRRDSDSSASACFLPRSAESRRVRASSISPCRALARRSHQARSPLEMAQLRGQDLVHLSTGLLFHLGTDLPWTVHHDHLDLSSLVDVLLGL